MSEPGYDREYYDRFHQGVRSSAQVVVPLIVELLHPRSVVDVGCGTGTWLKVFEEQGLGDLCGFDGEYVPETSLEIPADRFVAADLRLGVNVDRRFDLAVSLEVAEHLPEGSAVDFVQSLTRLAPVVMFSAAIPHQGGLGHVNEQWPDYWQELFRRCDFMAVDCLRPKIWENPDVRVWYAQNILLFVEHAHLDSHPELKSEYERSRDRPLSIVHPTMFERGLRPWSHLERLKDNRDKGIVTQEEFQAKKAEILSRL
jgi:SAM-dependent methyltransferase